MNPEKLDYFLQRVISYSFYSLFFFVPFLFYTGNSELFEFNKMVATYGLTVVITGAWIGRCVLAGKLVFQKTILDIPLLLFLLSQTISTLFSIDRHTSIWGYYSRSNGGLLSTLSYLILYWAYVSNIDKEDLKLHIKGLLFSSLIISIYAILEHFGRSFSCILIREEFTTNCWVQDVQNRVFATLGQPNWLAAWLVAIAPLAWAIGNLKFNIATSGAIFAAILFTKSRSGLLAFAGTFGIFWFFNLLKQHNFKILMLHVSSLAILVSIFGTPWTNNYGEDFVNAFKLKPSDENGQQLTSPPSGTVLETGGTESFSIRQIVWKGAIDIWRAYPLLGSGVETFAYSYYQHRPLEHNQTSEWDFLYNKAHNEYLNYLSTTGSFGFLSYMLVILTFIVFSIKYLVYRKGKTQHTEYHILHTSLLAGFTGILITNYAGFSVVPTAILFYLFPAMAMVRANNVKREALVTEHSNRKQIYILVLLLIATLFSLLKVVNIWRADLAYAAGDRLTRRGQPHLAVEHLSNTIDLRGDEPLYYNKFASSVTDIAVTLFEENEATKAAEIAEDADKLQTKALSISPRNIQIIKEAYNNYSSLSAIDSKYLQKSHDLAEYVATLAPTDPKAQHMLGLSLTRIGQKEQAIQVLERSRDMRPDFPDPRYVLASLYAERGDKEKAKAELLYLLENVNAQDSEAKRLIEELDL